MGVILMSSAAGGVPSPDAARSPSPSPSPPPPPADCLSCRVTGTLVCGAASASLAWRAGEVGRAGGHRGALVVGAVVLGALAVARAATP